MLSTGSTTGIRCFCARQNAITEENGFEGMRIILLCQNRGIGEDKVNIQSMYYWSIMSISPPQCFFQNFNFYCEGSQTLEQVP